MLPKVGYETPLRQAGITFLICYVGLGPASDIYKSLWRFWGIVLGVRTAGFVFLFWWPESASDKTIESLKKLMRTTLALGKETAQGKITEERLVAIERRLSANLLEVLTMADQARLEGRSGSSYSTVGIETATTLFRIAYRFEIIARGRLSGSEALLPQQMRARFATLEEGYCAALDSQLSRMMLAGRLDQLTPSSTAAPLSATGLKSTIDELADAGALEGAHWSADVRSNFVAQLESYRRLPILLASLDKALSKMTAS